MSVRQYAVLLMALPAPFALAGTWANARPANFFGRELASVAAGTQRRHSVSILETKIERFELTEGIESIGGATMQDAVNKLRHLAKIPICLEEVQSELLKDSLTLDAAMKQLEMLRTQRPLSIPDQARWSWYQKLAREENPATFVVGINKKTFRLPGRSNATVRAILDELVQLDLAYAWKLWGAPGKEIIVIQPRTGSVLSWRVDPICKVNRVPEVYHGGFDKTLNEHKIALVEFELLPNAAVDLCRKGLTAEDVLNLAVQAAGSGHSWTLAGTMDNRFLTFSK